MGSSSQRHWGPQKKKTMMMMRLCWACGYGENFCCGAACGFSLISLKPSRPLEANVATDGVFNSTLLFGEGWNLEGLLELN